jgi:predicted RNase H-like HicB family nuclease
MSNETEEADTVPMAEPVKLAFTAAQLEHLAALENDDSTLAELDLSFTALIGAPPSIKVSVTDPPTFPRASVLGFPEFSFHGKTPDEAVRRLSKSMALRIKHGDFIPDASCATVTEIRYHAEKAAKAHAMLMEEWAAKAKRREQALELARSCDFDVEWSTKDRGYVATVKEFPMVRVVADNRVAALDLLEATLVSSLLPTDDLDLSDPVPQLLG